MKLYCQTQKKKPIDWNAILDDAIKGKKVDENMMHARAGEWTTCACGNLCDVLERDLDGEPMDKELSRLGMDFYNNIEDKEYKKAKKTLALIEKHSAKLIAVKEKQAVSVLKKLGYVFS